MNNPSPSSVPRVFAVASFGRSGTVWLSKVLNTHPEVQAHHEGVMAQAFPKAWHQAGLAETENWLLTLSEMSRTQVGWSSLAAVGDLNSIGGFHRSEPWENDIYTFEGRRGLEAVPGIDRHLLLREPIVALESKRRMVEPLAAVYEPMLLPYLQKICHENVNTLGRFWPMLREDPSLAFFGMLCVHLHWVLTLGYPAVRLEDLSGDGDRLQSWLRRVTGLAYDPERLAEWMGRRENRLPRGQDGYRGEAATIVDSWSEVRRALFVAICGGWSARHGYGEPLPVARAAPRLVGVSQASGRFD